MFQSWTAGHEATSGSYLYGTLDHEEILRTKGSFWFPFVSQLLDESIGQDSGGSLELVLYPAIVSSVPKRNSRA
jgi:hypothetical protein